MYCVYIKFYKKPFLVCLMNTLKRLLKASSNLKLDLSYMYMYLIKVIKYIQHLDKEVLLKKNISKAHKKHESRSNGFVFPHFVASLYSVDISYRMVAFNLCESFVNSLIESIQITFLIVLLITYEYSVPTCTRRNLAPKQTLTKPRVYFLGLFGVCLGSAFRKIRVCSGITMDLHEICS